MDSSKVMGDEVVEECCSTESGWTMYIASSPDHDDDNDGDYDDENDKQKTDKTSNDDDDDDDDDDMASDASSGHPTHPQLTCGRSSKGLSHSSHGSMGQYKHAEDEPPTKSPLPDNKRVGRKRDEKTKIKWVLDSDTQSGAKVRKTH